MTAIPLPTLGIDMLTDEVRLRAGAVRTAVNVDIDTAGQFKRRDGYAVVNPSTRFTSIHTFGQSVFVGLGADLCVLNQTDFTSQPVYDMGSTDPLDFCEYNGDLYVAGPRALCRISGGTTQPQPVGVRIPLLPSVAPTASGALTAGRYGVAVSMVDASGEESPAVLLGAFDLTAGLRLEGLVVVPGHRWRVYLTPPDGDVLYLAEEFGADLAQYSVSVYPGGAQCETLNLEPMPPGDFVRASNGRLFVAAGDTLWFSEAMRPHLTAPRHSFIRFVGRIRFVEFTEGGAFVGDDRGVWFLAGGDPTAWSMRLVSSAVAVRRSSVVVGAEHLPGDTTGDCAVWLGTQGYMVGTSGGGVMPLHADRIRIHPATEGRSVFLTRDGIKQVITLSAASSVAPSGVAIDTAIH